MVGSSRAFSKAFDEFKFNFSALSINIIFISFKYVVLFKYFKRFLVCSILIFSESSIESSKKKIWVNIILHQVKGIISIINFKIINRIRI